MKCQHCGTEAQDPNAKFCIKCGNPIGADQKIDCPGTFTENKPTKSVFSAWLIVILLVVAILVVAMVLGAIVLIGNSWRAAPAVRTSEPTTAATVPSAMPNCEGWNYLDAVDYLEPIGCEVKYEYVFNDTVPAEVIIQQTVPEGTLLNAYSVVEFTVSKGADICPYAYRQKITVTALAGSRSAQLVLYDWENGGWVSKYTCAATVGKNGIGSNYGEGKCYTPKGTFKLGVALSQDPIGNDAWPVRYVTYDTCVVDDTDSPYYNTIQSISALPYGVGYDAVGKTLISGDTDIFLYIEHNGNGLTSEGVVRGKGSVITLCGRRSGYSAHAGGCVDITQWDMNALIQLLDYSKNPHIEISTL